MKQTPETPTGPATDCPLPWPPGELVTLAHGAGGRLTHEWVERVFKPAFGNPQLNQAHDGAALDLEHGRLAFTTDHFVINPLFFPGGSIGSLAVNGTVNDLAMCGAAPRHLSAAFVIGEGMPMATVARVARDMAKAARQAGVSIVTGDTKVVERGAQSVLFIATAGIGLRLTPEPVLPARIAPGDALLISGDIGRHGVAVMACRAGLGFETPLESDCAPLHTSVRALVDAGITIHCLRDLTRGGLATALVELATATGLEFILDESAVPVGDAVRGACELLGLDPLYVANEGRFIALVPAAQARRALAALADVPVSAGARQIGTVTATGTGRVVERTAYGTERILDMLNGDPLPRIC